MTAVKLKWRVEEAPTGPYRSFHKRMWPSADYANGQFAGSIRCEDGYEPRNVKTGNHKPLTVTINDYSDRKNPSWTVRKLKGTFATLPEAKQALADIIARLPHFKPEGV